MMTITARKRVLLFLERSQAATAAEVARALNITAANARHHLLQLIADGLVRESAQRVAGRRGRPTKVYRLENNPPSQNAAQVLAITFDFLVEKLVDSFWPEWASFTAERLAGLDVLPRTVHITRRLASAIDKLNTLKYRARWEAHAAGPRIILGDCPYISIVEAYPHLCCMDVALLTRLIGRRVTQAAMQEPDERGLPYCLFLIQNEEDYEYTHFSPRA